MQEVLVVLIIGTPVLGGRDFFRFIVADVGSLGGAVWEEGWAAKGFFDFGAERHGLGRWCGKKVLWW